MIHIFESFFYCPIIFDTYIKYVLLLYSMLPCPAAGHRMWALQRLRKLLTTEYGQSININRLLGDSEGEARSMVGEQHN